MTISRRALLWTIGVGIGLTATACADAGSDDPAGGTRDSGDPGSTDEPTLDSSLPSTEDATTWLQELVEQTGLETSQVVTFSPGTVTAVLLNGDGGESDYTRSSGGWEHAGDTEQSILTSPATRPLADLPLDRLGAYGTLLAGGDVYVTIWVDHAGRIGVSGWNIENSDTVGLLADGSGLVPELDLESADGVRAAVAEITAGYGTAAAVIGSFNDFVHMDGNVDGVDIGLRIMRNPATGAQATINDTERYSDDLLFDPSGFDPTLVLERKAEIVGEAGVEGEVWDWAYRRPPQGGDPMISYGVGPDGPSTRIWLNPDGSIAQVVDGECPAGTQWCPS